MTVDRRTLILTGLCGLALPAAAAPTAGQRLARAARAQVGVTREYDSAYRKLAYPGGDAPRVTGVCADVIVRAARDALGLDLQSLVHRDMARAFDAYPSARRWGLKRPDANIDHRRVLNLEVFFRRAGAQLWRTEDYRIGSSFPVELRPGDILSWALIHQAPHIGMVVEGGALPRIVHNIGGGAKEEPLAFMWPHRARAAFRWPALRS